MLLVAVCSLSGGTQAQDPETSEAIRLTLISQTAWQGAYGWCSFIAETRGGTGGVSHRCGGTGPFGTESPGPSGGGLRQRALTVSEVATLRQLYRAAALFDGGHVGADPRGSDLPFEILMVSSNRGAVVLVTPGNRTFDSGARRELIDWLRNLRLAVRNQ